MRVLNPLYPTPSTAATRAYLEKPESWLMWGFALFVPEVFLAWLPLEFFLRWSGRTETELRDRQLDAIRVGLDRLPNDGVLRSQTMVRSGFWGVLNIIQIDDETIRFLGPEPDAGRKVLPGEGYREYLLSSLQRVTERHWTRHIITGMTFTFFFSNGSKERCEIMQATEWREAFKANLRTRSKLITRY